MTAEELFIAALPPSYRKEPHLSAFLGALHAVGPGTMMEMFNLVPAREHKELQRHAEVLEEALRLTQEYVGDEVLPMIEGWSHFDALLRRVGGPSGPGGGSVTGDEERTPPERPNPNPGRERRLVAVPAPSRSEHGQEWAPEGPALTVETYGGVYSITRGPLTGWRRLRWRLRHPWGGRK